MQSVWCKPYTFTIISFTSRQCSSFVMGNVPPHRQRPLVEGGKTISLVCHKCTVQRLEMSQPVWNVTNALLKGWRGANEQEYWAKFRCDYDSNWFNSDGWLAADSCAISPKAFLLVQVCYTCFAWVLCGNVPYWCATCRFVRELTADG